MEVILNQTVEKVGKIGAVVKVKEGFARNFLFPQKLASPATPGNLKRIEAQKAQKIALEEKVKSEAQQFAEKLSKASCTINVEVNDLEKMYGSVSESDIVAALKEEGYTIDKKSIVLENPITELGTFEVPIKLHPEVTTKVRLWVVKK